MKKAIQLMLFAVIVLTATSLAKCATLALQLDSCTSYAYRGMKVEKQFVLQPSSVMMAGPMVLGMWVNYGNDFGYDELDVFGSYTKTFGKLTTTVGGQLYNVKDINDFADVTLNLNLYNVNIFGAYNFLDFQGFYGEGNWSKTYPLYKKLSVTSTAGVGFNSKYHTANTSFSHVYGQLALAYQACKSAKMVLTGYQQIKLDEQFESFPVGKLSFVREF